MILTAWHGLEYDYYFLLRFDFVDIYFGSAFYKRKEIFLNIFPHIFGGEWGLRTSFNYLKKKQKQNKI